jgi:hypothetical protein
MVSIELQKETPQKLRGKDRLNSVQQQNQSSNLPEDEQDKKQTDPT